MCEWGTSKNVMVWIAPDLSASGRAKWKSVGIDSCIADLVNMIQRGGVMMRGSCCGHGRGLGDIHLQDGRILLICNEAERWLWMNRRTWFILGLLKNHIIRLIRHKVATLKDRLFWVFKKRQMIQITKDSDVGNA